MFDWPTLISAFFIGLLGAGHCLGMCGGLVAALSFALPAGDFKKKCAYLIAYSVGRVASYTLIGFIAGVLGLAVMAQSGLPIGRIVAGVLLILLGLYVAQWWKGLAALEKVGNVVWRYIKPLADTLLPVKNAKQALFLGALWGWLPCGLVYSALSFAFASSHTSAVQGALVMLAFGLGTLPAVVGGGFASKAVFDFFKLKSVRTILALCYIAFGITTLYFVYAHAGHAHHTNHSEHMNHSQEQHNPHQANGQQSHQNHRVIDHDDMDHSQHTMPAEHSEAAKNNHKKHHPQVDPHAHHH